MKGISKEKRDSVSDDGVGWDGLGCHAIRGYDDCDGVDSAVVMVNDICGSFVVVPRREVLRHGCSMEQRDRRSSAGTSVASDTRHSVMWLSHKNKLSSSSRSSEPNYNAFEPIDVSLSI